MSEYIVNLDGELGMALAVACAGAGFAREEIVRCRDCKYYGCYDGSTWCSRTYEQVPGGVYDYQTVKPEGFCAWGEREEIE